MTGLRRLMRAAVLRSLAYRRMFTFRSAVKLEAAGHPVQTPTDNRQRASALEALSHQRARLLAQLALDRERGRRPRPQTTFAVAD